MEIIELKNIVTEIIIKENNMMDGPTRRVVRTEDRSIEFTQSE